ncbi:hypothetical protein LINGRAHAP2_LOCUS35575 [Linum grandiflorum]
MSRIDDGERRLYQCARKYDQIVNQFDVLVEIMTARARPPKRRRISSSRSKSTNDDVAQISPDEAGNDGQVFVETITKFLQELKDEPAVETDSSSSTRDSAE